MPSRPFLFFWQPWAGIAIFVREEYLTRPEGIKNNGAWLRSLTARGIWGWLVGVVITGFYVCLYWFPEYLTGLIQLFDPLSQLLRGAAANQWFVYGTLYTAAVLLMGVKFIYKYRHNPQGTPMAHEEYAGSALGTFFFFFGLAMFFIGTPILTYFFGKRWYCSIGLKVGKPT